MLLTISSSFLSSCTKQSEKELYQFYDFKHYELENFDSDDYESYFTMYPRFGNKGLLVETQVSYTQAKIKEFSKNPDWDQDDNTIFHLDYYSLEGEHISHISEKELLKDNSKCHIVSYYFDNDVVHIVVDKYWNGKTYYIDCVFNPENWERISEQELVIPSGVSKESQLWMIDTNDNYVIYRFSNYSEGIVYLCIYENGNLVGVFDSSKTKIDNVCDIEAHKYNDDKLLIRFFVNGDDFAETSQYYFLNINTMDIEPIDKEITDKLIISERYGYLEGVGPITYDYDGIKVFSIENNSKEVFIDYNSTFLSRKSLIFGCNLYAQDEKIYAYNYTYPDTYGDGGNRDYGTIDVLTKADYNPRTDREEITVGYVSSLYELYDEISRFNQNNNEYYISIDTSYDASNLSAKSVYYKEYDLEKLSSDAYYIDKLAIDLKSGEGPDLVFNTSQYNRLNNSDYLMDLSSFVDTLDENTYSKSIINSEVINGKIYQLPLGFNLQCITIPESQIDDSIKGFDFGEYNKFLENNTDKKDPIKYSRNDYFQFLLNTNYDVFFVGGKCNIDNDEFKNLANYCKDSIPEYGRGINYGMTDGYVGYSRTRVYLVRELDCMELLGTYGSYAPNVKLIGLPSVDGRGPIANIRASIAISKNTKKKEGCQEFIKTLLGYEYQDSITKMSSAIPVNKEVLRDSILGSVDEYNKYIDYRLSWHSKEYLSMNGEDPEYVEDKKMDNYVSAINNCEHVYRTDPTINIIFAEEMPAFFENQKSLDEVIKIITDRVNTYLSQTN